MFDICLLVVLCWCVLLVLCVIACCLFLCCAFVVFLPLFSFLWRLLLVCVLGANISNNLNILELRGSDVMGKSNTLMCMSSGSPEL